MLSATWDCFLPASQGKGTHRAAGKDAVKAEGLIAGIVLHVPAHNVRFEESQWQRRRGRRQLLECFKGITAICSFLTLFGQPFWQHLGRPFKPV